MSASYSLGMHRASGFMALIGSNEVEKRTKLWKSLVILDAFTCAYIGRPPLISEEDAGFAYNYVPEERCPATAEDVHNQCLDYSVGVSQTIRQILRYAYAQESVSAGVLLSLLDCGRILPTNDNSFFGSGYAISPVAVFHARLMQMHAIILATRPFFMHIVRLTPSGDFSASSNVRLATMAKNCLIASTQVISLVYGMYETSKLSNCDPTWM